MRKGDDRMTTRYRMLSYQQVADLIRGKPVVFDDLPIDCDAVEMIRPSEMRGFEHGLQALGDAMSEHYCGYDALASHSMDLAIEAFRRAAP